MTIAFPVINNYTSYNRQLYVPLTITTSDHIISYTDNSDYWQLLCTTSNVNSSNTLTTISTDKSEYLPKY